MAAKVACAEVVPLLVILAAYTEDFVSPPLSYATAVTRYRSPLGPWAILMRCPSAVRPCYPAVCVAKSRNTDVYDSTNLPSEVWSKTRVLS